ncbi:uncharacterized protein LOC134232615 [Saccostrea cucullata]|uniref:uncharacterized protein LOC134232615 n=1 Tax=Saccostrea cuccullata TaxID=36930 RepID=UPI002ED38732
MTKNVKTPVTLPIEKSKYVVVGGYDKAYRMLTFTFTSNNTENSGKSILVNTTCDAGTVSCFKANVTHNETHAVIMCQHSFFNVSEQISIIDWTAGVPIETCRWNQNTSRTECEVQNHGHPLGIDGFITKYTPGLRFLCTMDRQSVELVLEAGGLTSGHDDQRICFSVYIIIFVAMLLSTLKLARFIHVW